MSSKPLIFVHPLTDSLQKLRDVMDEIAEDEAIEIYDVEEPSEVAQLIPTVGQSLSIFGNAKKCAMVLQPNRKVIQRLNSKVILLSKKSIPRKTLDKFSKIGLTECVVEPVAPKTLLYKVKLLLRSIVIQSEEEDEDMDVNSFGDYESEKVDKNEKQRVEKGLISEEDHLDYQLKGKIKNDIDIEAEDEEQGEGYQEDAIEGNWKGNVEDTGLDLDKEEKDKDDHEDQENYIDAYLRGKKSNLQDVEFEDEEVEKKKQSSYEDDDYDDQINKEKSQDLSIDLEKERESKEKEELEADDKYYKGKVSGMTLDMDGDDTEDSSDSHEGDDEEEESDNPSNSLDMDLEYEDEVESKSSQEELEEDENSKEKNSPNSLDLEEETENGKPNSDHDDDYDDEEEAQNKNEASLDLEEDGQEREKKESELNFEDEDESSKKNSDHDDSEEIDKYYKGELKEVNEIVIEEDIDARNRADLEADEDDEESKDSHDETSLDLEQDDEEDLYKKETKLDLTNDEQSDSESSHIDDDEDDEFSKENNSLDLEMDSDDYDLDTDNFQEDDEELDHANGKLGDLDLETDEAHNEKESNSDDIDEEDYSIKKNSLDLDIEEDIERNRHSGHTEHIETNYSNKKSIKHQEYDWDIVNKKDKDESIDLEKKKKSDIQISFKEKVDLGEQTIDYRKLHSEFEAITITREGVKKKKTGPKYYSGGEEEQEYLKAIYGDEYDKALEEIAAEKKKRAEEEQDIIVYHPAPLGLDIAIKVNNLYHNKVLKQVDIFSFISQAILETYRGHCFFYSFDMSSSDYNESFRLDMNTQGINSEIMENWEEVKETLLEQWRTMNLPAWEDDKMISEDNIFYYPIYEGANKLGFVIVMFDKLITKQEAKPVEIILETTRGIILDNYRNSGLKEDYQSESAIEDKKEEKEGGIKSFFGKLFGKKAS